SGCIDEDGILYNATGNRTALYQMTGGRTPNLTINQTDLSNFIKDFCNDTGVCMAMVCQNKSIGPWWHLWWQETTLKGGQCWIIKGNATGGETIDDLKDDLDSEYAPFRIGAGSSFLDGIINDYYTNCTAGMKAKWLFSTSDNRIHPHPDRERLERILERNQMPIIVIPKGEADLSFTNDPPAYIGSSQVGRVDEVRRLINDSFKDKDGNTIGPVIIILEQGAELSDAECILDEASVIKESYPEVLIAVDPPKENRTEFLDIVIKGEGASAVPCKNTATGEINFSFCVDMIAEDIIFNDYKNCNGHYVAAQVLYAGLGNLRDYRKPTIIYSFGGYPGNNTNNTCQWFDTDIANTYETFMRDIPGFVHAGILGMQQCRLTNDTANINPLCNNSNYSVLRKFYAPGDPDEEIRPFKVWTVNSWGYVTTSSQCPLMFSENGVGTACLKLINLQWFNPDYFLNPPTEDEPYEERSYSDIEYTFYDDDFEELKQIGDEALDLNNIYEGHNTCVPAFVCGVHKKFGASLLGISGGYASITNDECALNLTVAGYADRYDLDIYLIYAIVNVEGDGDLNNKSHEFYMSYRECQELIKEYEDLSFGADNVKDREQCLIALAYYDYYKIKESGGEYGEYAEELLRGFKTNPEGQTYFLQYLSYKKDMFPTDARDALYYYAGYLRACDWYYKYENRCFD
ncbi:hypothetical protein DRJ17_06345, partial [Candidatus Woesearchaeota archaeon]